MFTNPITNLILATDSYKASHWNQYPVGSQFVSSYIESRGGEFDNVVFFGLQYFIEKYLKTPITCKDVLEAKEIFESHGEPFNEEGWNRIVDVHRGYIPVTIQALPEGTVTPQKIPLVQVINTDPELPWITSYIETALLRAIWYPTTVASLSRAAKEIIHHKLVETSDNPDAEIMFKLHDFGARGASSQETAMLGGMAHLVNFMGTDTVEALVGARKFYGEPMAGYSIPASEHSTITAWGKYNETQAYKNMIDVFDGEGKLFACVSDSYDIFNAVRNIWGGALKEDVQKMKGTLVIRPDSGDPVSTPIRVIDILMERFGYEVNSKGFKVLPKFVRVIQGDGINLNTINQILYDMKVFGLSASNIAFGMGGALLQGVNRDTLRFAMKANSITINGETKDIFKEPMSGDKTSKKGIQVVTRDCLGTWKSEKSNDGFANENNLLKTCYSSNSGHVDFGVRETFSQIRERAKVNV